MSRAVQRAATGDRSRSGHAGIPALLEEELTDRFLRVGRAVLSLPVNGAAGTPRPAILLGVHGLDSLPSLWFVYMKPWDRPPVCRFWRHPAARTTGQGCPVNRLAGSPPHIGENYRQTGDSRFAANEFAWAAAFSLLRLGAEETSGTGSDSGA